MKKILLVDIRKCSFVFASLMFFTHPSLAQKRKPPVDPSAEYLKQFTKKNGQLDVLNMVRTQAEAALKADSKKNGGPGALQPIQRALLQQQANLPKEGVSSAFTAARKKAQQASCQSSLGYDAAAIQWQKAAVQGFKQLGEPGRQELRSAKYRLSGLLAKALRNEEALALLDEEIALLLKDRRKKRAPPLSRIALVSMYGQRADLTYVLGDTAASLESLRKAKTVPKDQMELMMERMAGRFAATQNTFDAQMMLRRELRLQSLVQAQSTLEKEKSLSSMELGLLGRIYAARGEDEKAIDLTVKAVSAAERDLQKLSSLGSVSLMNQAMVGFMVMHEATAVTLALRNSGKERAAQTAFYLLGLRKDRAFENLGKAVFDSPAFNAKVLEKSRQIRSGIASRYLAQMHLPPTHLCDKRKENGEETVGTLGMREATLFQAKGIERAAKSGRALLLARQNPTSSAQSAQSYFHSVRAQLREDELLLDYVLFAPADFTEPHKQDGVRAGAVRYGVMVVSKEASAPRLFDLGPASEIDASIQALSLALSTPPIRASSLVPKQLKGHASKLYQKLFPPDVREQFAKKTALTIIPDGSLQAIPFSTLFNGKDWLLDTHQVSYLSTTRALANRKRVYRRSATPGVVFAGPTPPERRYKYPGLQPKYWPSLPGTAQEAQVVLKFFPGTQKYEGQAVTERRLLNVASPRFLHIASHAVMLGETSAPATKNSRGTSFQARKPGKKSAATAKSSSQRAPRPEEVDKPWLLTAVVAAPPAGGGKTSEDSFTTALEISRMDLRGTEMVVLSACETGRGVNQAVHGISSLRRAFTLAGAQSVIASLWKIEDNSSSDVISDFYSILAQGETRSAALRQAQQQEKSRRPHPFFWGPLTMVGKDGTLCSRSEKEGVNRCGQSQRSKR